MYKVKVVSHFSAAHSLREYQGKCEALHGHNWKVEVVVQSRILNALGMVIDFTDLKSMLKEVLNTLDHTHLNDSAYFGKEGGVNPSSESIARYIFKEVEERLVGNDVQLAQVLVWETQNSCAIYSE